jgi:Trk K+ transport system NAD-binding subunit|tara:strand:- start:1371 stop:1604 length:234 start_codon:yes stop_codon:yes gene_type:complete
MGDKTKFVIIGAGAAGVTLAKSIADGQHGEIIIVNDAKDKKTFRDYDNVIINKYSISQIDESIFKKTNFENKSKFHK